jgi:hypothetical protein
MNNMFNLLYSWERAISKKCKKEKIVKRIKWNIFGVIKKNWYIMEKKFSFWEFENLI